MNEDYDISDNSDSDVSLTNKKNAGRVFSEHPDDENEEMDEKSEKDDEKMDEEPLDDDKVEDAVFDEQRENKMLFDDDNEENEESNPQVDIDKRNDEISVLEQKLINKKAWQTIGEIKGMQRPLNSLLEQNLDFNINKKAPTVITVQYNCLI